jgi:hypothetical protein
MEDEAAFTSSRHHPEICVQQLRKTTKYLSRCPDQDSNRTLALRKTAWRTHLETSRWVINYVIDSKVSPVLNYAPRHEDVWEAEV